MIKIFFFNNDWPLSDKDIKISNLNDFGLLQVMPSPKIFMLQYIFLKNGINQLWQVLLLFCTVLFCTVLFLGKC